MRSSLTIKSLVIVALSLTMLAGCGRKNGLSPTGVPSTTTQKAAETPEGEVDPLLNAELERGSVESSDKPLDVDVGDKPFILDKLL